MLFILQQDLNGTTKLMTLHGKTTHHTGYLVHFMINNSNQNYNN